MSNSTQHSRSALAIWSGLIVVAVLLLSRRWSGEFVVTTPVASIVMTLLACVLSAAAWLSFQTGRNSLRTPQVIWGAATTAWIPTWLCGAAVAPSNSPVVIGWLIGVATLSALGLSVSVGWSPIFMTGIESSGQQTNPKRERERTFSDAGKSDSSAATINADASGCPVDRQHAALVREVASDESDLAVFPHLSPEPRDGTTTQWMTRQTLADGSDVVEGSVRVELEKGQRLASVHVPFVPPFTKVPAVECEASSDDEVRWKVSVVYTYGMRVEVKRDSATSSGLVDLAYSATCDPVSVKKCG